MSQRHPNDSTVTLDPGHADLKSPLFVPIHLRDAFAELDEETVLDLKRQLWTEITPPLMRTYAGKPVVVDHLHGGEWDFNVALTWLKLDEAARRVNRANELRDSIDRSVLDHTCGCCGRVDATARSGYLTAARIPAAWCDSCRGEWARQETLEHAARKVGAKTVEQIVATARRQATP